MILEGVMFWASRCEVHGKDAWKCGNGVVVI